MSHSDKRDQSDGPLLEISYRTDAAEYWQGHWNTWKRVSGFRVQMLVYSVFGGLAIGMLHLGRLAFQTNQANPGQANDSIMLTVIVVVSAVAGLNVVLPFLLAVHTAGSERRIIIDAEGITTVGPEGETLAKWSKVANVHDDGRYLVVDAGGRFSFSIPGSAFADAEQRAEFFALVAERRKVGSGLAAPIQLPPKTDQQMSGAGIVKSYSVVPIVKLLLWILPVGLFLGAVWYGYGWWFSPAFGDLTSWGQAAAMLLTVVLWLVHPRKIRLMKDDTLAFTVGLRQTKVAIQDIRLIRAVCSPNSILFIFIRFKKGFLVMLNCIEDFSELVEHIQKVNPEANIKGSFELAPRKE